MHIKLDVKASSCAGYFKASSRTILSKQLKLFKYSSHAYRIAENNSHEVCMH